MQLRLVCLCWQLSVVGLLHLRCFGEAVKLQGMPSYLPGHGWPGYDAPASNLAWASGRQPDWLQEWRKTPGVKEDGTPNYCWDNSVVYTTPEWPGECTHDVHSLPEGDDNPQLCQSTCVADPFCSVWLYKNISGFMQCYNGLGTGCWSGDNFFGTTLEGQRIQHGFVRTLKDFGGTNMWVKNLRDIGSLSSQKAGENFRAVDRCREWCYSNIRCQYWQFAAGMCWVEDPPNHIAEFPLTNLGITSPPDNASQGEYIQHFCSPAATTPAPIPQLLPTNSTGNAQQDFSALSSWAMIVLALLLLLTLMGACWHFCCRAGRPVRSCLEGQKARRDPKGRAVHRQMPEENISASSAPPKHVAPSTSSSAPVYEALHTSDERTVAAPKAQLTAHSFDGYAPLGPTALAPLIPNPLLQPVTMHMHPHALHSIGRAPTQSFAQPFVAPQYLAPPMGQQQQPVFQPWLMGVGSQPGHMENRLVNY